MELHLRNSGDGKFVQEHNYFRRYVSQSRTLLQKGKHFIERRVNKNVVANNYHRELDIIIIVNRMYFHQHFICIVFILLHIIKRIRYACQIKSGSEYRTIIA